MEQGKLERTMGNTMQTATNVIQQELTDLGTFLQRARSEEERFLASLWYAIQLGQYSAGMADLTPIERMRLYNLFLDRVGTIYRDVPRPAAAA
jgi:hypothetical protein